MPRIVIAADHAGFDLKQVVVAHLRAGGHEVDDLGTHSTEPVDYPPLCAAAARKVVAGEADFGIVLGGSGQGETLSANKVRGARAALCLNEYTARLARSHNDANVLGLGGRVLGDGLACSIVDIFLSTPFEGGRHEARVAQIAEIEAQEAKLASTVDGVGAPSDEPPGEEPERQPRPPGAEPTSGATR